MNCDICRKYINIPIEKQENLNLKIEYYPSTGPAIIQKYKFISHNFCNRELFGNILKLLVKKEE